MRKKKPQMKILQPEVLKVPDSIIEIFDEANGLLSLRERYVMMPFGYRKARKCSIEAEKKKNLFWRKIRNLYPLHKNKGLTFHSQLGELEVAE